MQGSLLWGLPAGRQGFRGIKPKVEFSDQINSTWYSLKLKMEQIKNNRFFYILPYLVFFTGSFLFLGFFADYVEFYQEKVSLFIFSRDYLVDNITLPGSLLVYLGRFLTTFYYYPLVGGLIISLVICLIILMISKIISLLTGKAALLVPLFFGTAFFILQADYQYLLFNSLGVLLQLLLFYLSVRYLKGFITVIVFPFWYLVTGGFAWIFALMYTIFLVQKSLRRAWPVIISLLAVMFLVIYILKEFFIFQPLRNLLVYPLSNEDTGSQFMLFLPLTGLIILLPLLARIKIRIPFWNRQNDKVKITVCSIVSPGLVIVLSILLYSRTYKEYFHAEKLFCEGRYNEINQYLVKHPTTNRLTIYLNNIALCENGRLNDRLFYFPQSPDGQSLFLKWEMYGEVLRRGAYFYYSTGMINEAQRWAYENMVMKGITFEDLRMLIKTEIINGNYRVASKYVSLLKKTVFYRKEARDFERVLDDPESMESNPELGTKRREKIEHDFFSITDNPSVNLEIVFTSDSLNRKVFDYRMAWLMLSEDYENIASGLARLEKLGYKKIPTHLEEAALVCRMSGSTLPGMGSLKIDPQTEVRFNQFLQTFASYGNNLKTAQPFLKQKFGNTFWYYGFYH